MGEYLSIDRQAPPVLWVQNIIAHCCHHYIDAEGMLVTSFDGRGHVIDDHSLIPDFGDVLPFLWYFGAHEFVAGQLRRAPQYLEGGLYKQNGRVRLFSNHDWLLGLLSLYQQSHDQNLLAWAEEGAHSVAMRFFRGDLLIDELPVDGSWQSMMHPASPFNGGFIELWIDLYRLTGNMSYLEWSQRLARGWIDTSTFRKQGIFARKLCTRSTYCDYFASRFATLKARLFKDNTNLIWGLLALARESKDPVWREAIVHWVSGFETYFLNDGKVYLNIDQHMRGYDPSLKAAFSSMEVMSDLYLAGIEAPRVRTLACRIADHWLKLQWDNGLFPEQPEGAHDHLDANLDFIVALYKLSAITGHPGYQEAADRCASALLKLHLTPQGYCLAVNARDEVVNQRIIVKYQALLIKLALLPRDVGSLLHDSQRLELLRDR